MYNGDWVKDKFEGIGKYIWEDGTYYLGEWKNDSRNGKGKFFNSDGNIVLDGYWINDKFEEKKLIN